MEGYSIEVRGSRTKRKKMTVVTQEKFFEYINLNGPLTVDKTNGHPMMIVQYKNEKGLVIAQIIKWNGKPPIHHIRITSRV